MSDFLGKATKGEIMLNRFASLALVIALISTVGGTSVFANPAVKIDKAADGTDTLPEPAASKNPKKEAQPSEKLRAGLAKLVADTKAGKGTLSAQAQILPTRRNNLSKGTKIAIGVGVAVAVVAAIVIVHKVRNLGDFDFHGIAIH